ncbi:MAG: hypothetical protein AAF597_18340, partial [Bacteroidota bacterium]
QQELETSKEAAVQTLQTTSTEAQTFVLRDVILPAAGIALAGYLTVKAVGYVLGPGSAAASQPNELAKASVHGASAPRPKKASANGAAKPQKPFYKSLLQLGTLLVPAGQAILEVVQEARK